MSKWTHETTIEKMFIPHDNLSKYKGTDSKLICGDLSRPVPKLSIAIPCFRDVEHFGKALKSALEQTVDSKRYDIIIVINDPSEDSEIVKFISDIKRENLYCYQNADNIGMFPNFNRCFELARTEWVLMLHDDDTVKSDLVLKAERAIEFFNKDNKLAFVAPNYSYLYDESTGSKQKDTFNRIFTFFDRISEGKYGKCNFNEVGRPDSQFIPPTCGMLFNRNIVLESGGFDESYATGDTMFQAMLVKKYKGYHLYEIWGEKREEISDSLTLETMAAFVTEYNMLIEYKSGLSFFSKLDYSVWKNIYRYERIISQLYSVSLPERELFLNTYFPEEGKGKINKKKLIMYKIKSYPISACRLLLRTVKLKKYPYSEKWR